MVKQRAAARGADSFATRFGTIVENVERVIQGKADGSFHGSDTLTRAQTATFDIRRQRGRVY